MSSAISSHSHNMTWFSGFSSETMRFYGKLVEMVGAAPTSLDSLSHADSSHACRHSFLADDDLNPFSPRQNCLDSPFWEDCLLGVFVLLADCNRSCQSLIGIGSSPHHLSE